MEMWSAVQSRNGPSSQPRARSSDGAWPSLYVAPAHAALQLSHACCEEVPRPSPRGARSLKTTKSVLGTLKESFCEARSDSALTLKKAASQLGGKVPLDFGIEVCFSTNPLQSPPAWRDWVSARVFLLRGLY